jgi:hypothetical protein
MKNFLSLLLLSATIFVSCKKDNQSYIVATDPNSLDKATVINKGTIAFSDDRYAEGVAKIFLRKDGIYVLGLEQMNYQSLFDTNVYLSNTLQLTTASIKVFSAKKLHGDVYYPMSSDPNIPAFKYLLIQSDTDTDPVASATLK